MKDATGPTFERGRLTVVVDTDGPCALIVGARDGSRLAGVVVELDVEALAWLVTTSGPAALHALRRVGCDEGCEPGAAAPGPADGESTDASDEQLELDELARANAALAGA